ncbi:MAG: pseudouridine-5-phosphate glycosidase [Acidobacteria bacterium]|nr:MAG: pseudouridine-5-phosphate glycosidase [Acidobacteriota bacterium]
MKFKYNEEVTGALHFDSPIVALESTVIAHGLPYPENIETAYKLERIIRDNGAVPATVGVFAGEICVGLNEEQFEKLATGKEIRKISRRDLPVAIAKKLDGATTVATTAFIAHRSGIKIFATGGIGGVHRGEGKDISADLPELANTPITVVCSGAKIVLDLPATREWLETHGISVLGWKCDEMPAFYSRSSGLAVDGRLETAREAAQAIIARDDLEMKNAILITVPVPEASEIALPELEAILAESLKSAAANKIKGKDVTPFLLSEMSTRSNGKTLAANIALLENNAKVASQIAVAI